MMAYFKPLRRKIGVVTLVVLSVFFVAWVRSYFVEDKYEYKSQLNSWTIHNKPDGIHYSFFKVEILPNGKMSPNSDSVVIPYLFVLLPLILLSAGLLLSKVKPKKPERSKTTKKRKS